jgi:acyl-CoA thioester hydrolase
MSEYGYTHPITIRLGDIDANEHVNNSVYTDYTQNARANYFRELWGDAWQDANVVLANFEIDFLAPVEFDDEVYVDVRVVEVGDSSWTVEYRIRAVDEAGEERVAARGTSVQVAWNREETSSRPLPDTWREALEAELIAPEP